MTAATDALLKTAKAVLADDDQRPVPGAVLVSRYRLRDLAEAVREVEDENRQGPP